MSSQQITAITTFPRSVEFTYYQITVPQPAACCAPRVAAVLELCPRGSRPDNGNRVQILYICKHVSHSPDWNFSLGRTMPRILERDQISLR